MTESATPAPEEPTGGGSGGRLFRVFVSSTFADLELERNALHDGAFRRLRRLCVSRGAQFQSVDLRWGVSEEAALDQQAVDICLEEIARSQRLTPRPNFVLLLGERYGWRPLPARISASELEEIRPHLDPEAAELVGSWYRRDDNAVPAEHVLRPREDEFEHADVWEPLERRLREALAAAAKAAGLDARALRRYGTSVTEQEAAVGILDVKDAPEHVHCFFRSIAGLPDAEEARVFRDPETVGELTRLKDEVRAHLGPGRIHTYTSRWEGAGPTRAHLEALNGDVYTALAAVIEDELDRAAEENALERERREHEAFGEERSRHFVGRAQPLSAVADELAAGGGAPYAVVGPSGVGKTAFMAKVASAAALAQPDAAVVVRFAGATDRSSTLRTLLQDLLLELRHARDAEQEDVPTGYRDLVDAVRAELVRERPRRVLLFVDALDQLGAAGGEVDLAWLTSELPESIRVVVSAADGPVAELLRRRLGSERLVRLAPMPDADAAELLRAWLAAAGRTLQPHQREEVLRSFGVVGLPLHLRLGFEQARRWPAFAPSHETLLADDVPGVIRDLFAWLARSHGERLVSRSLGYLAAARNGLSEDELLDVLSADADVVREFRERSPRSPAVGRIPNIVWSRLFSDLEPYLNERRADGRLLLGFYHRQLAEVAEELFLADDEGRRRHAALAAYFDAQALELRGPSGAAPNLRKLSELPYQQTRAGLWGDVYATLTDFAFLERKIAAFEVEEHVGTDGQVTRTYPGVFRLQDDLELALEQWPNGET